MTTTSTQTALESPSTATAHERYGVSEDEYRRFRSDGFLVVRGLVSNQDVAELRQHTDDMMQGRLPEQEDMPEEELKVDESLSDEEKSKKRESLHIRGLFKPASHLSPQEKAQQFLRIHMLHRKLSLHERYLLHPRVLDVVEAIIGPDVSAMQSMLFLKPPGSQGQGWHQDSYYIPTVPDSLLGAWIAIDDADEYNGGLWFAKGSHVEPVHPPCPTESYGFGDRQVKGVQHVSGVSNTNDDDNMLSPIADRYDQVLAPAKAGDVVFFGGHVLHRSKANITSDRFRRAFVGHYCNARSFTAWGHDDRPELGDVETRDEATGATNGSHILARGDTHLAYARPRFGTPCSALLSAEQRRAAMLETVERMRANDGGLLGCGIVSDAASHAKQGDGGY